MLTGSLLWLLGVPIPILILILLWFFLSAKAVVYKCLKIRLAMLSRKYVQRIIPPSSYLEIALNNGREAEECAQSSQRRLYTRQRNAVPPLEGDLAYRITVETFRSDMA